MNGTHRPRILSSMIFVVFAGSALAACASRSVIGQQQGTGGTGGASSPGTAGTGGAWASAGTSGGGGTGGEKISGAAGLGIPGGDAGTSGTAGIPGDSPGTAGALGIAGWAGSGGSAESCSSASGGGAGTGTPLSPPTEYATNRYASFVELGDLNGDGKPDLVVTNYFATDQTGISAAAGRPGGDGGSVSVFLSQPGGDFAKPQSYELRDAATSLAVGDLDGDGKADVAVVNRMGVNLLMNDGTGRLLSAETYTTGIDPVWVAMGDLNNDGRRDLAVANRGYSVNGDTDGDLGLLLNIGQNPRFAALNLPAGRHPVHVAIGDLDGDLYADLAVANSTGVTVLTHDGTTQFAASRNYGSGIAATSTTIVDVNGDGRKDLVLSRGTSSVGVLLQLDLGLFAAAANYLVPTLFNVAVGDITGDGKPDLIGSVGVPASCGEITVARNEGNGTFGASVSIPVSLTTGPVTVVDLNGDGKADVAVPNIAGVAVLLNAAQ